jgi:hypothetical protein
MDRQAKIDRKIMEALEHQRCRMMLVMIAPECGMEFSLN